ETRSATCPAQPRLKSQGAKLSFSGVSVRGGTGGPSFYIFMKVWHGLSHGRLPPGRRKQEAGFFPARENRSPAWACTRKQPRACAAGQRHKPGARIAHRRCARRSRACVRDTGRKETRCATCPAQPRLKSQGAKLSFSS